MILLPPLPPLDVILGEEVKVEDLTDKDVLALCDLRLESNQDKKLSELLDKQGSGMLTEDESSELRGLIQVYQVKLLRQAQALAEAVRRGLREPLKP